MKTLIHRIKTIYTSKQTPPVKGKWMAEIETISDAYVLIEGEKIVSIGQGDYDHLIDDSTRLFDAQNTIMIPGLIDAHTHLVFAGSREDEFQQKIAGVPYLEILAQGGGILSTVESTREASFDELYQQSLNSLNEMMIYGVTSLEVKSGYGLNLETEIKQLRVAKKLNEVHPIDIYATYLGAHALPKDYIHRRDEYISQIIKDLEIIKKEQLATFVDVFCEVGVFTAEETKKILEKATSLGFKLRVHTDEIESIGGTKVSVDLQAKSVDHLMAITDEDIKALAASNTIANLLPSTSFFLNKSYAPARKMIDQGCAVAVSSDYNPGSTPSENYQLTLQIAGNKLKMLPNEILTAATINPAYSLDIHDLVGTIEVGKQADLLLLDAPNFDYFIYHYGVNHTRALFKKGQLVVNHRKVVNESL